MSRSHVSAMITPLLARLRASAPPLGKTSSIPRATSNRSVGTRKQKSRVKGGEEDIGSYLTGANKLSSQGDKLGAGDAIFMAVGIAVLGYVGWLAKDEVKEVTWPEIKHKGKEVKEAVKEVGEK